MNLKAYASSHHKELEDRCLFGCISKSKSDARRFILNHGMLSAVDYVIYKGKRYSINQIYKWSK